MASVRNLAPLVRRSVVATRSTQSSLRGGASPPLPPFARSPIPTQKVRYFHWRFVPSHTASVNVQTHIPSIPSF